MTSYAFETITAEDALNIRTGDYLTFAGGPASHVSVVYHPTDLPLPGRIDVTFGGRTVTFGEELSDLSLRGALEMADGSRLRIGGLGNDHIFGSDRADALFGGAGDDHLDGGAGDDLLHGNQGDDVLKGGLGSNTLYGGKGNDVIHASSLGETKGSWAHGNQGDDEVFGGDGADTLYGGQGDDFIGAKDGDDFVSGDLGNDEIMTGHGNDTATGGAGDDSISSSGGSDWLRGDDGNDQLVAYGSGGCILDGGAGNDTLVSASWDQSVLFGGEGRDRFELVAKGRPGEGHDDLIADWSAEDQIYFPEVTIYSILPRSYSEFVADSYDSAQAIADEHISAAGARYVAAQVGEDVVVFADTDGDPSNGADIAVVLIGANLSQIGLENFI